jgi:hypothetical protein
MLQDDGQKAASSVAGSQAVPAGAAPGPGGARSAAATSSVLSPALPATPLAAPPGQAAVPARFRRVDLCLAPEDVAAAFAPAGDVVFLDTSLPGRGSVSIIAARPAAILRGHIERDWHLVAEALARHANTASAEWPLPAGGLFGWAGFDGEFAFALCPRVLGYAHDTGEWFDFGGLSVDLPPEAPERSRWSHALDFEPLVERDEFIASVRRAQEYITAGDIYQVNLSFPWRARWPAGADAFAFYERLRAVSPAPSAAFVSLGGAQVLSASPECFLKMSGRDIVTRPIKGTRPRFRDDPDRDTASAAELLSSDKERAELLMITDLERNDLGQVCEFGSVTVPDLWRVEKFAQVFHLVSTVSGVLREGVSHAEAFRACFPGGSISGAPKKRALEIIAELERHPRGHYTGAIGYFGFNGESQFSIAIRTAVLSEGAITFHTGSGIVADSVPEREHEETLQKAGGILRAGA